MLRSLPLTALALLAVACSSSASGQGGDGGAAGDGGNPFGNPPADAGADAPGPPNDGAVLLDAARDTAGSDTASPSDGAPPGSLQPGTSTLTIPAAGQTRTVYLHVPQAVTQGPVPLVIALHGDGDTAQNFVTTNSLDADSDQEGFVLAAPQGITRDVDVYVNGQVAQTVPQVDWDPYNSITGSGTIVADHNIDLPLLDAIRTQLVASGSIDVKRVVVYGYSQGGYLSFRYGMSDATDEACTAVLAAATPLPGTMLIEQAARKIPVCLQIGTADPAYANAQQTVQELQQNGNPVQFNAIQGAGHVPPPGDPKVPLDYCLQHPLP